MRGALITLLYVFILTPLSAEETDYPTDEDLAKHASEAAATIKGVIGDDWTLSVKERTITIESKFDIFRVYMISRPNLPPPLDSPTERLRKEAIAEKYVIRLRFERPLDREELIRRREERQKHADVLNFGASSKKTWSAAAEAYGKIQVPRYVLGFYQIYRELSESPGRQVYPLSALKEIGAAKQILDTTFNPMRTGND